MLNSSLFISYSFIQLNQWRKKPYESKMNWFWFNSIFSLYIFDRQKKQFRSRYRIHRHADNVKRKIKEIVSVLYQMVIELLRLTIETKMWSNREKSQNTTKTLNALKVDCTGKCTKWKVKHNQSIREITPQEMQVQLVLVVWEETRGG